MQVTSILESACNQYLSQLYKSESSTYLLLQSKSENGDPLPQHSLPPLQGASSSCLFYS